MTKESTTISRKKKIMQIRLRIVNDKSSSAVKNMILKSSAKSVTSVTSVINIE